MNFSSLRFKIFLGFGLISVMLLLTGLVSLFGLWTVRKQTENIQRIKDVNATVLEIDRDIQEMRLRVDRYVSSGHPSLKKEVRALHSRVEKSIGTAKNQIAEQQFEKELEFIERHVRAYAEHFEAVVSERQLREELVYEQLPKIYQDAESAVQEVLDSLGNEEKSVSSQARLASCLAELSRSEEAFLRYFENPNSEYVNQAIKHLDSARANLDQLSGFESAKKEINPLLSALSKTGLRAVQATRSYLFFRNVVMAGEQSEVTHYAKALRESTKKREQAISLRSKEIASRSNWVTSLITLGTVGFALFTAMQLGLSVLPPLEKLKQTFGQLTAGETLAQIPGQERNDEIGELAHAASVFSDQNLKTRELLEKAESLTAQLEQRAIELTASNEELDRFAYVASHDLKSPLRGIRQLAEWITEDSLEHLPEASAEHLGKLRKRVSKMEQLLEELLSYSRVGRVEVHPEPVNTFQLVTDIEDLLDNPDQIRLTFSKEDLPTFETLAAPFKQILMNLIGNAIKHNHRGAEGKVEITCRRANEFFVFSIADNGPGIDKSNHERAFQMFQRVGNVNVDGSGLGLAMVRKQVQSVGGIVKLDSELGKGSRFEFSWPVEIQLEYQQVC